MKQMLLASVLAVLATGCASTSDVAKLQGQIDVLGAGQKELSAQIAEANKTANAALKASQAAEAASRAINEKIDRLFKRAQLK